MRWQSVSDPMCGSIASAPAEAEPGPRANALTYPTTSKSASARQRESAELPSNPAVAYDRGRQELLQATSIDEVKDIRDKTEALRRYWKQRRDRQMEAALSAIRLRADYEIGVRSAALEMSQGERTDLTLSGDRTKFKRATLKQAGIPFQRASENEKLAEMLTPKQIDALCRRAIEKSEIVKSSEAYLLRSRADKEKAAFHRIEAHIPPELHVGDFREKAHVIPDNSIELIFTDPPWSRLAVPLYGDLAEFAARVLKPGGALIAYSGHAHLIEAANLMSRHLDYHWTCAHVHNGGPSTQMREHGIVVGFKPLLWFTKGASRRPTDLHRRLRVGAAREVPARVAASNRRRRALHRRPDLAERPGRGPLLRQRHRRRRGREPRPPVGRVRARSRSSRQHYGKAARM